jgi:hypothetical protein
MSRRLLGSLRDRRAHIVHRLGFIVANGVSWASSDHLAAPRLTLMQNESIAAA